MNATGRRGYVEMTNMRTRCGWMLIAAMTVGATPALAQSGGAPGRGCGAAPPYSRLFIDTLQDVRRTPSASSFGLLAAGGAAALGAHSADSTVARADTDTS